MFNLKLNILIFVILLALSQAIKLKRDLLDIQLLHQNGTDVKQLHPTWEISLFLKIIIFFALIISTIIICKYCILSKNKNESQKADNDDIFDNNYELKAHDQKQYNIVINPPDIESISSRDKDRLGKQNSKQKCPKALFKRRNEHTWNKHTPISGNNPCQICPQINTTNTWPIMKIRCSSKHLFHMNCINQYRKKQFKAHQNDSNPLVHKCPKCQEAYPQILTIYCPQCEFMAIDIDSAQFMDKKGKLKVADIMNKYGEKCNKCSLVS